MKKYNRYTTAVKKRPSTTIENNDLSVIIPAAGTGHRMKSYGPKCLLPISTTQTIIENIIKNVKKGYPNSEITTVVGFEADRVIKTIPKGVRIIENQFYSETNVVESLRLALNSITNTRVLIIYGDLIFNTKSKSIKIRAGVIEAVNRETHSLFSPHNLHIKNITKKIPINMSV